MPSPRCVSLVAVASLAVAFPADSRAQQTPPVPTKTLPAASAPGAAVEKVVTSPTTGIAYTVRVEPEEFDSDEGERAQEPRADSPTAAAAPSPHGAPAIPATEFFKGTDRKAAKLSVPKTPFEPTYNDLKDLIATLPSKSSMVNHTPPITTAATSNRVKEEERNVRVLCWLYAASRENDNDYHLILGRAPGLTPPRYMTMELSGLPPFSAASFPALKGARDAFNKFFGTKVPVTGYDFYPTPIPVRVEGSLFFDMTHANGTPPGPSTLRPNMPVIWEVHPITSIVFEPSGPLH